MVEAIIVLVAALVVILFFILHDRRHPLRNTLVLTAGLIAYFTVPYVLNIPMNWYIVFAVGAVCIIGGSIYFYTKKGEEEKEEEEEIVEPPEIDKFVAQAMQAGEILTFAHPIRVRYGAWLRKIYAHYKPNDVDATVKKITDGTATIRKQLAKVPDVSTRFTAGLSVDRDTLERIAYDWLYFMQAMSDFSDMSLYGELDSKLKDHEFYEAYIKNTFLHELFSLPLPLDVPDRTRMEHQYIVAGTGHGKTQTLQSLICDDLKDDCSIVVIDSQGDLIDRIKRLSMFADNDRLMLIDPHDLQYPVALNLFDVGRARMDGYDELNKMKLTNNIIELYDFVLSALLSAEMTQRQSIVFRFLTRLMLNIPDATIHTFKELLEPGGDQKYAEYIAELDGTARSFFDNQFKSSRVKETREQVLSRLYGILENQTFERMFTFPKSKVDLFSEMNAGKVILIDTAKDLLKQSGTEIFGRFFIAMIAQAAFERTTVAPSERKPVYVYIDEAQDYFDKNIELILTQARKYNVGLILAHQYLGQLPTQLRESIISNTSIKCVGGVSPQDARVLAPSLFTTPEHILDQGKGSFALYAKGTTKTAVTSAFTFGRMEKLDRMTDEQFAAQRERMRERYATPVSEFISKPQPPPAEEYKGSFVKE